MRMEETMDRLDPQACYRASVGRDRRWDGRVYIAVITTGIYCRPSCPARKPLQRNCRFYPTAAAAVAAGFRACRRCQPDALPGSRRWDLRADLAARSVRMIRDGVIDEVGVVGLAAQLNVSERHLHRILVAELGAGPQQLNRTRRAQTARLLIEQTELNLADVAFAAGFASVRQFNDVMRAEFGETPSRLRRSTGEASAVVLRLRYRPPLAFDHLRGFLTAQSVPGLDRTSETGEHTRTVPAAHGPAVVTVALGTAGPEHITATLQLSDLADLSSVVARVRRWLDLDADPDLIDDVLRTDPLLEPLVRAQPGVRIPGAVDGFETTVLAMLRSRRDGGGTDSASRLVRTFGAPAMDGLVTFPTAETIAAADPMELAAALDIGVGPARMIGALATAVRQGLVLAPGADRNATRQALQNLPGIDQSIVDHVTLRVLGDPDAFPRDERERALLLGSTMDTESDRWRPWRGYAQMHLWNRQRLSGPISAR